jgi:geranylgeranyl pyrophosphate synthase
LATAEPQRQPDHPAHPLRPGLASGTIAADCPKVVPESRAARERILARVMEVAAALDKSRPLARHVIEGHARAILAGLGEQEQYAGWAMVMLGSEFWREQVAAVPFERRLLLLPHCLRNAETCPAEYGALGLVCQDCGACRLTELRAEAERLGYRVMIAEGSPVVMQTILSGQVDAILGVACLNVLERALEKILMAGIPSMAVPLLGSTCRDSQTDEDWVLAMIRTPHLPTAAPTETYLHLLRCAAGMFEPDELQRLAPRSRGGPLLAEADGGRLAAIEPLDATEAIAYDFLLRGGKHTRPLITLAAYDAMTGGRAVGPGGQQHVEQIPDAVRRIALAIEVFHKASLVHDDIEDDDPFRYGYETLHRKYSPSLAINVGDYLVGLGYRLVAGRHEGVCPEVTGDVLARLADAHTRLCEGQGAELAWRDARQKRITPLEALKIYALKTAPAFEAALYAGIRLAGPAEHYRDPIVRYTRHLGVAFQILNDLQDWDAEEPNKRTSGTDVLGGRPTVLWALALEGLDRKECRELDALVAQSAHDRRALTRVRELYQRAEVFRKAAGLIEKHHDRARQVAESVQPPPLRHLLHYFVDTILKR